jgi:hypothetical protein
MTKRKKPYAWDKRYRGRYEFSRASGEWHLEVSTIVPIISGWNLNDSDWQDGMRSEFKFRHFYGELPEKYTIIDVWEGFE